MAAQTSTDALVAAGVRTYVPNYAPKPVVFDRGEGSRLWDLDGREYIDLGTGISVNSFGHRHPELVEAVTDQVGRLWHASNLYYVEPTVRLAEALVDSTFAERVFFCNSGAEANEAAIKLVRKHASEAGRGPGEREIITFEGSFHGRTLATVTATAQPKYQEGFEPVPGGFTYCAFNKPEANRSRDLRAHLRRHARAGAGRRRRDPRPARFSPPPSGPLPSARGAVGVRRDPVRDGPDRKVLRP